VEANAASVIVGMVRELAKHEIVDARQSQDPADPGDMVGVHISFDDDECEGLVRVWYDETDARTHVVVRWKPDDS
jgi:hypothetical protein